MDPELVAAVREDPPPCFLDQLLVSDFLLRCDSSNEFIADLSESAEDLFPVSRQLFVSVRGCERWTNGQRRMPAHLFCVSAGLSNEFCCRSSSQSSEFTFISASVGSAVEMGGVMPSTRSFCSMVWIA